MKKFNIFITTLVFITIINGSFSGFCKAQTISGNINKEEFLGKSHIVVDGSTGLPVADAKVSIPTKGIFAKTNNSGRFNLDISFKSPTIISVQAYGYKPFSLTINENKDKSPLIIVVEKLFGNEIVIDTEIHHLGDDNFSKKSANAEDFKLNADGADFFKEFFIEKFDAKTPAVLKIGSIIGLDTKMAHRVSGKSKIKAFSSSMQVYINSKNIGEIKINGDNQEILLPKNLLKGNSSNTIRIKTGINQQAASYIDYDDMEFMNLLLVF